MKLNYSAILESLKKKKPRDFVYPGVFILFAIIVTILFLLAMRSISKNINNVFSYEQSNESLSLDIERYSRVTKKLNITIATPNKNATSSETTYSDATTTQRSPSTLDKSAITITVVNSTKKSGLAAELANMLVKEGFTDPKTENGKKQYATTTVLVKENKNDYIPVIMDSILKLYPNAISTTTAQSGQPDVTIIIGTN